MRQRRRRWHCAEAVSDDLPVEMTQQQPCGSPVHAGQAPERSDSLRTEVGISPQRLSNTAVVCADHAPQQSH